MEEQRRFEKGAVQDCPFYIITRTSLLMTSAFKKAFAAAGMRKMRPAYLAVLWRLWEEQGVRMSDLARTAGLEPSTMTGLLDRMERDGLVFRRADPDDRRALKIYLTGTGADLQDTSERLVQETLDLLFEGIEDRDLDVTKDVLRRVMENNRGGA